MSVQIDTIAFIASVVGVVSASSTLFVMVRERISQKAQSSALKEDSFSILLESSDIEALGKYLDEDIGKLYISDYVDNSELTRKVDLFINKLTQLVGTEEEIENQTNNQKIEEHEPLDQREIPLDNDLPHEFGKIIYELHQGETWNALAKLRRYLEIKLKEIAKQNGFEIHDKVPITKILDTLRHMGVLKMKQLSDLKTSIQISNRAIHGQTIELKEAELAIYIAAKVMEQIDKNTPNMH